MQPRVPLIKPSYHTPAPFVPVFQLFFLGHLVAVSGPYNAVYMASIPSRGCIVAPIHWAFPPFPISSTHHLPIRYALMCVIVPGLVAPISSVEINAKVHRIV